MLSQPGQVLQIPAPQAVTGNIVAMPTLKQNIPVPVAAPPVVNLCSPLTDDDVSHYFFTNVDLVFKCLK